MTRQIQLLVASTMPRKAVPGRGVLEPSVTRMRVHPGDLDFYLHVNNGVYLQMMDVARSNFIADLGGFPLLKKKGWYPVVAASTMKYRRSLQLWDRFEIATRVLGWDSVEAHETGFRGSSQYQRWRELLHHFYEPFPTVEHFRPVEVEPTPE